MGIGMASMGDRFGRDFAVGGGVRSLSVETEMLSIAAARAAREVLEELGTSCTGRVRENDDGEVEGGGEPYETITDVNEVMSLGDSLSRTCWGSNAAANRAYYIVDSGHVVTVKPRVDGFGAAESVRRVDMWLGEWLEEVCWSERQAEVSHRLDRHGEVFDLLYFDPDGERLRLSFAEPVDLDDDVDSPYFDSQDTSQKYVDLLGVRRTNDVLHRPVGYYIDGSWYEDLGYRWRRDQVALIPRNRVLVQHRKRNVLSVDPRGLTLYWPVRDEMVWAKRLLSNLMRVSSFQAAFGAIRTISNVHSADAVKAYLNTLQGGTAGAGVDEKFDFPAAAVVTKPEGVVYEFPETGAGASNHIEVELQLLRAVASGLRLPEFMLTANVGEGNFASTLVSEGPFHKGMRFEQGLMVREDMRILWQALRYAASRGDGGLSEGDLEAVRLEVKPPRVQTRNRKEDFEVNQKLWEDSLLSGKDFLASEDRDYEDQQKQIAIERSEEHPAAVAVTGVPGVTGPVPGVQADQMSEKGVLAGEPREVPEK